MCPHHSAEECFDEIVEAGHLAIDAEGRVWRLKRWIPAAPRGTWRAISVQPRRVDCMTPNGYFAVGWKHDGRHWTTTTSRLVWSRAHGSIPPGLTVNHRDGVKTNNRLDNLELATRSEQGIHAAHVLGNNHFMKLTEPQVREIRWRLRAGEPGNVIAQAFGVDPAAIYHIAHLRSWRHLGDQTIRLPTRWQHMKRKALR
jgi:hypothetical protein